MTLDYKDWFILTRTNNEKDVIKDLLRQKQIPSISFQKRLCSPEEINEYVNRDAVKLLTIHAAKGLESEKVIVVGAQTYNDEECRVAYVAATRAKSLLYWCPKIPKSRNTFATGGMITFGESRGRR
jgi:superfamily I DNA/RNA helicase